MAFSEQGTGNKEEAKKLTEKLLKKGEDAFWERIA